MAASKSAAKAKGYGRCPICGSEAELVYRPFCSARCRDIDLARWLGGGYAIPGHPAGDEDGEDKAGGMGPADDNAAGGKTDDEGG